MGIRYVGFGPREVHGLGWVVEVKWGFGPREVHGLGWVVEVEWGLRCYVLVPGEQWAGPH